MVLFVDVAIDVANDTHGREHKRCIENARGDESGGEATDKKATQIWRLWCAKCRGRPGAWFLGVVAKSMGTNLLATGEKFKNHPRARDTATSSCRSRCRHAL